MRCGRRYGRRPMRQERRAVKEHRSGMVISFDGMDRRATGGARGATGTWMHRRFSASLQRLFTASREKGCLQDPTRRKIRRHASWRIRHSPGEAGFATRRGFPGGDVEARGDGRRSLRQRFGCARRRSINGAQRASPEIGKRLSCPFRRVDQ
jgi:hypothetical protein